MQKQLFLSVGFNQNVRNQIFQSELNPEMIEIQTENNAPIESYKINSRKFFSFLRFHTFSVKKGQKIQARPLTINQLNRLKYFVREIYISFKNRQFKTEDLKGVWSLISFFFWRRSGLIINQFFILILHKKLTYEMYKKFQAIQQVEKFMLSIQNQEWPKDKSFTQSIQILMKPQDKTSQAQANNIFGTAFNLVKTLNKNSEFDKEFQELIQSLKEYGVLKSDQKMNKKPLQRIPAERQYMPLITNGTALFQQSQNYVLSQPDTLIADLCQEFQQLEIKQFNRKLSFNENLNVKFKLYADNQLYNLDVDTQTQLHEQRTAHRQESRQINSMENNFRENDTFRRRIQFDEESRVARTVNVQNRNTTDYQRTRRRRFPVVKRPPRNKYVEKMSANQRKITNDHNIRLSRKQQKLRNEKNKLNQTKKLEQQNQAITLNIRRTFIDKSIFPVQKRDKRQRVARQIQLSSSRQKKNRRRNSRKEINQHEQFISTLNADQEVSSSNHKMDIQIDQSQSIQILSNPRRMASKMNKPQSNQKRKSQSRNKNKQKNQPNLHRKKLHIKDDIRIESAEQSARQKKNYSNLRKKTKQTNEKMMQNSPQQNNLQRNHRKNRITQGDSQQQSNDYYETINFQKAIQKKQQVNKDFNANQHNLSKYSHLLYDPLIKNLSLSTKRDTTLDYFLLNHSKKQFYQPLQNMKIRELSIFTFESQQDHQSTFQAVPQTVFQRLHKEQQQYQKINRKYEFSVKDYFEYLSSMQSEKEIFKQLKIVIEQYLSFVFKNSLAQRNKLNQTKNPYLCYQTNDNSKLVLIGRKIITFYLITKSSSLPVNPQFKKIIHTFKLTYIEPLINHFMYKIACGLFGEITNALFKSQGDEDFDALNLASFNIMVLLYDLKNFILQFPNLNQSLIFLIQIYADLYRMFTLQSEILFSQLFQSQKSSQLLSYQKNNCLINLPRTLAQFINKSIQVKLKQSEKFIAIFSSFLVVQKAIFKKMQQLLQNEKNHSYDQRLHLQITNYNQSIGKLNQTRNKIFQNNGSVIKPILNFIQFVNKSQQNRPQQYKIQQNKIIKGNNQMLLTFIQQYFNTMGVGIEVQEQFRCKIRLITLFTKNLITNNSLTLQLSSQKTKLKIICYQMLEQTIQSYVRNCLLKNKNTNINQLFNKITIMSQLKQHKQLDSNKITKQQFQINLQINLCIVSALISFTQFRDNTHFFKTYALKKVFQQFINPKHNLEDNIFNKIFNAILVGYKYQIYEKGKLWLNNDNFLSGETQKCEQYWQVLHYLYKTILSKYISFSKQCSQLNYQSNGNRSQYRDQRSKQYQKLKKYQSFIKLLFNNILCSSGSFNQIFKRQNFYKLCNEDNCLLYSIKHFSNCFILISENKFFTDMSNFSDSLFFTHHIEQFIEMISLLYKLTSIQQEIDKINYSRLNQPMNQDTDSDLDNQLFNIELERKTNSKKIIDQLLNLFFNTNTLQNNLIAQNKLTNSIDGTYHALQLLQICSKRQNITSFFIKTIKDKQHYISLSLQNKELSLQELNSLFEYLSSYCHTMLLLMDMSSNQKVSKVDQILKQFHKININIVCNFINSIVWKNALMSSQENSIHIQGLKTKKIKQISTYYCKVYQSTILSRVNIHQATDQKSINYSIYKRSLNQSESISFENLSSHLLKQSILKINPTKQLSSFSKEAVGLLQNLYQCLKGFSKNSNKERLVAIRIVQLFNLLLQWPELPTMTIKKIITEFQIFTNGLIQHLISVHQNHQFGLNNHQRKANLSQAIKLISDCLTNVSIFSVRFSWNVYGIKQNIPNFFKFYILKRIIKHQSLLNTLNESVNSRKLTRPNGNNWFNSIKVRSHNIKSLNLMSQILKQLQKHLSSSFQPISKFLRQLLCQFINPLRPKRLPLLQPFLSRPSIQPASHQSLQLQSQYKNISNYKQQIYITFLNFMRQSQESRQILEQIFVENIFFFQKIVKQFSNNYEEVQYYSIQDVILKCMINHYSDFYNIKMLLNSRIIHYNTQSNIRNTTTQDNIRNTTQNNIEYAAIQNTMNDPSNQDSIKAKQLLIKCMEKAIKVCKQINSWQRVNKRCNQDLEQWFIEKQKALSYQQQQKSNKSTQKHSNKMQIQQ